MSNQDIEKEIKKAQEELDKATKSYWDLVSLKNTQEEAARKARQAIKSEEKNELIELRKSIKNSIDKFNELSGKADLRTSLALLTHSGFDIYELDDNGENTDGEFFSEYGDDIDTYPSYASWYPSSMSC